MSKVLNQRLDGAVILVTGAAGGIGQAICAALREGGARVVGSDVRGLPESSPVDISLQHDVTSPDGWTQVMDEIHGRFGRLDCLVNNAGISFVETIAKTTLEQWRRVMSVNVESVLLGLQSALPLLTESGRQRPGGSSIVNVSSIAGLRGGALSGAYGASKAAVGLLTKCAAKEFAALGCPIRVNSIHPGVVETAMIESVLARCVEAGVARSAEEQRASWSAQTPLGRTARAEDIAGGVVFLCSPAAGYMTGAELVIDGGFTS